MNSSSFAAALVLIAVPLAALAQSAAPSSQPATSTPATAADSRGKVRTACSEDVKKFCASIERGKGQMRSCLETHKNELSDVCKSARVERAARAKEKG